MNMLYHPSYSRRRCPCGTVNHNWTKDQRADLCRRLDAAERYGLPQTARKLRERLMPCPDVWRHIP